MNGGTTIPFIVCAGIGALLNAVPLPKAISSRNVGTTMLIIWTELACLVQFANAIRWNGNTNDWAPLWCDFCGRFLIATDVALVGAGVSINRRLYMILTLNPRRRQQAFNAIVDIVLCLVIPLVSVALEYVVQQYRYYIVEDVGCIPGVGFIDLAFPLVWMLPLLIGSVSAGYACRIIYVNLQRNYKAMGEPTHSLAWSRRLLAIAVVSTLYPLVPTSITIALMATVYPVTPWPGWKTIHSTINDVIYVPAQQWHSNSAQIACIELRRWTIVSLAFVIFIFLGSTSEVKKMYWAPFRGTTGQVFPTSQAGCDVMPPHSSTCRAMPKHDTDEKDSNSVCGPSEEMLAERRRTSPGSADGSRLDADLEIIELALPSAETHSISSLKPP